MPIQFPGAILGANTFTGDQTISSSSLTPLNLASTDAGAALGPIIDSYRNSASPAANDILGGTNFTGNSSTGVKRTFASMQASIVTATNAAEDGSLKIYTMRAGTLTLAATFFQDGTLTTANAITATGDLVTNGGYLRASAGSRLGGGTDGNWLLTNNAISDFGLLQFGGTTSSFPAWKRVSAGLSARLADDSLATAVTALSYTSGTPNGGTAGVWKMGVRVAATVILDTTQYVQLDIGGTLYKVGLVS